MNSSLVAVFPVTLLVPAVIGTPIALIPAPAMLALFMEIVTGAIGLPAALAMFCNGTIEIVLGFLNPFAALMVIVVGA